jgi:DNA repair protein RadD
MQNNYKKWEVWVNGIAKESLGKILGPTILESLEDEKSVYDFILKGNASPLFWLDKSEFREKLILSQPHDRINSLADFLGISGSSDNPWEDIQGAWPRRKIEFCAYFKIDVVEEDEEAVEHSVFDKVNPSYSLFPHQDIAARKLYDYTKFGSERVVLHMPTGSGKTRTTMTYLCRRLADKKIKIIWIADTSELCLQASAEFEKAWGFLGDRPVDICRLWGGVGDRITDIEDTFSGIIIASIQTLTRQLNFTEGYRERLAPLQNNLEVIVFDEAHKAVADTYKTALELLQGDNVNLQLIGLTATPGRGSEDEDLKLAEYFLGNKIRLSIPGYDSPVTYLIEEEYLAEPKFKWLEFENDCDEMPSSLKHFLNADPTAMENSALLKHLGKDVERNTVIRRALYELCNKEHDRILYFAPSVENSENMALIMSSHGFTAYSITDRTSPGDRRRWINEYLSDSTGKIVLCNYGVLTTGFDAPRTSAAFIARPTKSLVLYSQMVGRAIRGKKAGGNSSAEIYTVIDRELPGFDHPKSAFDNWEDQWAYNH